MAEQDLLERARQLRDVVDRIPEQGALQHQYLAAAATDALLDIAESLRVLSGRSASSSPEQPGA
jgi:hypothetical protein